MEAIIVSGFSIGNIIFVKYNEKNVTHDKTLYKLWYPLIISIFVGKI